MKQLHIKIFSNGYSKHHSFCRKKRGYLPFRQINVTVPHFIHELKWFRTTNSKWIKTLMSKCFTKWLKSEREFSKATKANAFLNAITHFTAFPFCLLTRWSFDRHSSAKHFIFMLLLRIERTLQAYITAIVLWLAYLQHLIKINGNGKELWTFKITDLSIGLLCLVLFVAWWLKD